MIEIRGKKNNFMKFIVTFLSVLIFTSFIPLSEVRAAESKCNVNKITSKAYVKCKAKEAKKLAKKKAKAAGKYSKKKLKNNPFSNMFKKLSKVGVKAEDMEKIEDGLKKSD